MALFPCKKRNKAIMELLLVLIFFLTFLNHTALHFREQWRQRSSPISLAHLPSTSVSVLSSPMLFATDSSSLLSIVLMILTSIIQFFILEDSSRSTYSAHAFIAGWTRSLTPFYFCVLNHLVLHFRVE